MSLFPLDLLGPEFEHFRKVHSMLRFLAIWAGRARARAFENACPISLLFKATKSLYKFHAFQPMINFSTSSTFRAKVSLKDGKPTYQRPAGADPTVDPSDVFFFAIADMNFFQTVSFLPRAREVPKFRCEWISKDNLFAAPRMCHRATNHCMFNDRPGTSWIPLAIYPCSVLPLYPRVDFGFLFAQNAEFGLVTGPRHRHWLWTRDCAECWGPSESHRSFRLFSESSGLATKF